MKFRRRSAFGFRGQTSLNGFPSAKQGECSLRALSNDSAWRTLAVWSQGWLSSLDLNVAKNSHLAAFLGLAAEPWGDTTSSFGQSDVVESIF